MCLQVVEADPLEHCGVGGFENDGWCGPGLECLLPPRRHETPLIAGYQPRKRVEGLRCRQIVACPLGELEELGGDSCAHRMDAEVAGAGVTTTVPIEAGERIQ